MANEKPTYEECLEIVRRLQTGGYSSEAEDTAMLKKLEMVYRNISNLIFWNKEELSPEQVLSEAEKQSKAILL